MINLKATVNIEVNVFNEYELTIKYSNTTPDKVYAGAIAYLNVDQLKQLSEMINKLINTSGHKLEIKNEKGKTKNGKKTVKRK